MAMTQWFIAPPPVASLIIAGDARRFAVRRILCVGQNYAAHAREMGSDADKPDPFFFAKPADTLVVDGANPSYPLATQNLHHEVELVVALGENALPVGWAVGVDLTRRDIQAAAKAKGRPWDAAKGFDQSAPCGELSLTPPAPDATITLKVNGEIRQEGALDDMLWDVDGVIAKAKGLWELAAGDIIFTGTPEGVGPLIVGDVVEAEVSGLPVLKFTVQA